MVSIVIPVYNAEDTIGLTLDSIFNSKYSDYEVIVVDDGSKDKSVEIASKYPISLIKLEKNSGPATVRNIGAAHTKGELLLFIDSDVIIHSNTVEMMANTINNGRCDAVCAIYSKVPKNEGFFQKFKALHNYSYSKFKDALIRPHTVFASFCAIIKKEIFYKIGGWDARYKSSDVEDFEFGHRLINKGYKLIRNSGIEVDHYFPGFIKGIKIYFTRTFYWTKLFLKRRKFDTGGTTFKDGWGMIIGGLFPLFLFLRVYILAVVSFVIFIVCFWDFFSLVYKEEGILFLMKTIFMQLFLSIVVMISVAYSVLSFLWKKK